MTEHSKAEARFLQLLNGAEAVNIEGTYYRWHQEWGTWITASFFGTDSSFASTHTLTLSFAKGKEMLFGNHVGVAFGKERESLKVIRNRIKTFTRLEALLVQWIEEDGGNPDEIH